MARINGSVSQRADSYSFYIDWSESKASDYEMTNKTTVTATAYVYCSQHNASYTSCPQKLIIDGQEFTATKSVSLSPGVTVALISGSKTITHNTDGSKSITISADCDLPDGYGWGPAWGSASGTVNLTTINRQAKVVSAPDINLGDTATVVCTAIPSGATVQWRVETLIDGVTSSFAKRTGITNTTTKITFTDTELDFIYKKMGTGKTVKLRYVIDTKFGDNPTMYDWKDTTCTLTGNIKTARTNVTGTWRRAKAFTNVSGSWKKAVIWTNVSGTWRRTN